MKIKIIDKIKHDLSTAKNAFNKIINSISYGNIKATKEIIDTYQNKLKNSDNDVDIAKIKNARIKINSELLKNGVDKNVLKLIKKNVETLMNHHLKISGLSKSELSFKRKEQIKFLYFLIISGMIIKYKIKTIDEYKNKINPKIKLLQEKIDEKIIKEVDNKLLSNSKIQANMVKTITDISVYLRMIIIIISLVQVVMFVLGLIFILIPSLNVTSIIMFIGIIVLQIFRGIIRSLLSDIDVHVQVLSV